MAFEQRFQLWLTHLIFVSIEIISCFILHIGVALLSRVCYEMTRIGVTQTHAIFVYEQFRRRPLSRLVARFAD